MALSALVVLVGYLVGVTMLFALLKRIVGRSATKFDDAFLEATQRELKWLAMVLVIRYSVLRLDFWSDRLRTFFPEVQLPKTP